MSDILDPLIFDLVEWVARRPRPYAEAIDAWRTSCPRLTVWEDAFDRGFIERRDVEGEGVCICATVAGLRFVDAHRLKTMPACPSRS
jgi:hypothetical protein